MQRKVIHGTSREYTYSREKPVCTDSNRTRFPKVVEWVKLWEALSLLGEQETKSGMWMLLGAPETLGRWWSPCHPATSRSGTT
jgi:hypothetical protein